MRGETSPGGPRRWFPPHLRPRSGRLINTNLVSKEPSALQMTGGAIPFVSGRSWNAGFGDLVNFQPPEQIFRVSLDVPRGTEPGVYSVRIIAAELASLDGRAIVPETIDGSLELLEPIDDGHVLPLPTIHFDEEFRAIVGDVAVRFTKGVGRPGDLVSMRAQVRTSIPLSTIGRLMFTYDAGSVEVVKMRPLYRSFETQTVDHDFIFTEFFGSSPPPFERTGGFTFGFDPRRGLVSQDSIPYDQHEVRSEYFPASENWVDLVEIVFRVSDEPLSVGRVPFDLRPGFRFLVDPYFPHGHVLIWPECQTEENLWRYPDLEIDGAFVEVLGKQVTPDPPLVPSKVGIRYELGTASASPGEEVRVPVRVTSLVDLYLLRMVFGYPSDTLEFVGFDVERTDANGEPLDVERLTPAVDPSDINQVCAPEGGGCRAGLPHLSILHGPPLDEVPEETIIIDLSTTYLLGGGLGTPGPLAWEAGEVHELGALVFRVRPDATAASARIEGREVTWRPESPPVEITSSTSGFPILEDPPEGRGDVPAIAVLGGEVSIGGTFLRADSTQNGAIEISDPVRTLGALFLGDPVPPCPDAEDANDDGEVNLSDAVYTLSFLFLGGPAPPAPFPEPGKRSDGGRFGVPVARRAGRVNQPSASARRLRVLTARAATTPAPAPPKCPSAETLLSPWSWLTLAQSCKSAQPTSQAIAGSLIRECGK